MSDCRILWTWWSAIQIQDIYYFHNKINSSSVCFLPTETTETTKITIILCTCSTMCYNLTKVICVLCLWDMHVVYLTDQIHQDLWRKYSWILSLWFNIFPMSSDNIPKCFSSSTEPCGTPQLILECEEVWSQAWKKPAFWFQPACCSLDAHMFKLFYCDIVMDVLKSALRSNRSSTDTSPVTGPMRTSVMFSSVLSVLWWALTADWNF